MIDCVIVDIDGTIMDITHREHLLWPNVLPDGSYKPSGEHWDAFHEAAEYDSPYPKIIRLTNALFLGGMGIMLCTGRGEEARNTTSVLLDRHNIYWSMMFMRAFGDPRQDTIVKREMLPRIRELGYEPLFAIEDRPQVIEMWHKEGIRCIQVRQGDLVT